MDRHLIAPLVDGIKNYFNNLVIDTVDEKSHIDYVTNVDHKMDAYLTEQLSILTPDIVVLSEERNIDNLPEKFWIIDPIDGTHNFLENIPFYAVSIALYNNGNPKLSAVIDLVRGDTYVAEKGKGAYVNGHLFTTPTIPPKLTSVSSGALNNFLDHKDLFLSLRQKGKMRNLGCQSLQIIYVALGKFLAALSYEAKFWDDAAASLFLEEAGGKYYSFCLKKNRYIPDIKDIHAPLMSIAAHESYFTQAIDIMAKVWENEIQI